MLSVVLSSFDAYAVGQGQPLMVWYWADYKKRDWTVFFIPTFSTSLKTLGNSSKTSNFLTKSFMLYVTDYDDDALELAVEYLHISPMLGVFVTKDGNKTPSIYINSRLFGSGALMFLFEGNFGNILHTGDCRLTPDCLQSLPEKYIGRKGKEPKSHLDYVFLDCTFGKSSMKIPSKYSAVRQEEILVEVSKTFGSKIFIDKDKNPECFHSLTLTAPEIVSEDPSSRFHVLEGFPKLYERAQAKFAEAEANFQPEPLIIRASSQWFVFDDEILETERQRRGRCSRAVRDQFGVWHICYSMHSSSEELEWAMQILAPKRVVSTTPNCRAMELDYVKKNCFGTQLASDDPLWKLLDIRLEVAPTDNCSVVVEDTIKPSVESHLRPVKTSITQKQPLTLSPPSKRPPVTLFGRARLGNPSDFTFLLTENKIKTTKNETPHSVSDKAEPQCSFQEDVFGLKHEKSFENKTDINEAQSGISVEIERKFEVECENPLENKVEANEVQCERSVLEKDSEIRLSGYSPVGSSQSFNESFRKLYRSMNVPVPRPLPSLVELMKANKRKKRVQC
ncbi:uncharacterized protein LOC131304357 isoform X4 [Rhododendron vialii]|uniref:uncharacterized protein LOC131304357 isoform X4 n=1 Tax=Rhododendron vialii TaxID=182163 RepID=UPI00265D6F8C|nr:uncharacterized protein LOC131304357 isoform X4 [Rhododendron vialii]